MNVLDAVAPLIKERMWMVSNRFVGPVIREYVDDDVWNHTSLTIWETDVLLLRASTLRTIYHSTLEITDV